jgi:hypothetical protein
LRRAAHAGLRMVEQIGEELGVGQHGIALGELRQDRRTGALGQGMPQALGDQDSIGRRTETEQRARGHHDRHVVRGGEELCARSLDAVRAQGAQALDGRVGQGRRRIAQARHLREDEGRGPRRDGDRIGRDARRSRVGCARRGRPARRGQVEVRVRVLGFAREITAFLADDLERRPALLARGAAFLGARALGQVELRGDRGCLQAQACQRRATRSSQRAHVRFEPGLPRRAGQDTGWGRARAALVSSSRRRQPKRGSPRPHPHPARRSHPPWRKPCSTRLFRSPS